MTNRKGEFSFDSTRLSLVRPAKVLQLHFPLSLPGGIVAE